MNRFYQSVANVLEVASVSFDTRFREVPEWCSLKAFGLLVTLENDWSAPLDVAKLAACATVGDLYREAFLAFAANLFGVPRETLSGATAYESIPAWDSVAHLRLVMEAENRFGTRYALERIPFLKTLDDFLVD